MSFSHDADRIRKRIKEYKTESLIIHLLNRLHSPSKQHHPAYDRAWISCLMLDWVLEGEPNVDAVDAKESDVHHILNEIWALQSKASDISGSDNIQLTMRAFIIKQLKFQEDQSFHITFLVRLYAMICSENASTLFERRFNEITGVSLEKFFLFSLFLMILFKGGEHQFLSYSQMLVKFHPLYSISEIEAIVHALGGSLYSARKYIQSKRAEAGLLKASDYHAEPFVIERPLIALDKGISIYHTYVATIGISEFVLRTLKSADAQHFRDKFTKIFESYVYRVLLENDLDVFDEKNINLLYKNKNKNGKVVDFICSMQGGTVYLDAKGMEPSQHILVSDSAKIIKDKVKNAHLKGIEQVSECISILESIGFENISTYQRRFALIVTHQDFYLGSAQQLNVYFGQGFGDVLSLKVKRNIPLGNIHFCCISDLEVILSVCKQTKTNLVDFLEFCTKLENDSNTSKFDIRQCVHAYARNITGSALIPICSESISMVYDDLYSKLCSVIKSSQEYWGGRVEELVLKSEFIKASILRAP
ncbi:hypothetical protein SJR89_19245 [Aeromonas caviae]|uniref:GapS1 family protein n=1 Tax=Aeromonas caviae TaxID=648 RepID=UPI0029DAE467|nr:hypothetical protein [Aeromonas caviae]MDX7829203.1 hypothetical protein [Aeromonas caviae]